MKASARLFLRVFLSLLLCLAGGEALQAKMQKVKYDSTVMTVRTPSKEEQRAVFSDSDYRYDKSAGPQGPSAFQRLLRWLFEKFGRGMNTKSGQNAWDIFWIILLAAVLVTIVLLLTRTDIRAIFSSRHADPETGESSQFDVDIHTVDFAERIAEAVRIGDYRLAVRLQFLYALKQLSDHNKIDWRKDKTNHDYYLQLSGSKQQQGFGEVSLIYEYSWYGDHEVHQAEYEQAQERFRQFISTIS